MQWSGCKRWWASRPDDATIADTTRAAQGRGDTASERRHGRRMFELTERTVQLAQDENARKFEE
jgi:hypothetical protein